MHLREFWYIFVLHIHFSYKQLSFRMKLFLSRYSYLCVFTSIYPKSKFKNEKFRKRAYAFGKNISLETMREKEHKKMLEKSKSSIQSSDD